MQIVIDIPEDVYTRSFDNGVPISLADGIIIDRAIRTGTVLPEHHGRLIDVDALNEQVIPAIKKDGVIYVKLLALQDLVDDALTIPEVREDGADGNIT